MVWVWVEMVGWSGEAGSRGLFVAAIAAAAVAVPVARGEWEGGFDYMVDGGVCFCHGPRFAAGRSRGMMLR